MQYGGKCPFCRFWAFLPQGVGFIPKIKTEKKLSLGNSRSTAEPCRGRMVFGSPTKPCQINARYRTLKKSGVLPVNKYPMPHC